MGDRTKRLTCKKWDLQKEKGTANNEVIINHTVGEKFLERPDSILKGWAKFQVRLMKKSETQFILVKIPERLRINSCAFSTGRTSYLQGNKNKVGMRLLVWKLEDIGRKCTENTQHKHPIPSRDIIRLSRPGEKKWFEGM